MYPTNKYKKMRIYTSESAIWWCSSTNCTVLNFNLNSNCDIKRSQYTREDHPNIIYFHKYKSPHFCIMYRLQQHTHTIRFMAHNLLSLFLFISLIALIDVVMAFNESLRTPLPNLWSCGESMTAGDFTEIA